MTRILLVEDHTLVRQSIRAFLESANLEVIGEATTGTEAVRLSSALQPDVVIMDIHLPEMNGIEATRQIRKQCKNVRVIALTAYDEPAYIRALYDAGAEGFVLKTAEFVELLQTVQRVSSGITELDKNIPLPHDDNTGAQLTTREMEVLLYTARGWTNKQIGTYLNISDRTVQVHLLKIYQKLGTNSRTEAVSRAMFLGLITPQGGSPL